MSPPLPTLPRQAGRAIGRHNSAQHSQRSPRKPRKRRGQTSVLPGVRVTRVADRVLGRGLEPDSPRGGIASDGFKPSAPDCVNRVAWARLEQKEGGEGLRSSRRQESHREPCRRLRLVHERNATDRMRGR